METKISMNKVKINITESLKQVLMGMSNTYATLLLDPDGIKQDRLVEDYVDFLSISSDHTKISYVHVPKEGEDVLSIKRYSCKPGALLQKMFKDLDSRQVENFSVQFKSSTSFMGLEFDIVEDSDLCFWYNESNYADIPRDSKGSSLYSSCMKYSRCSPYLRLYTQNPNIVKLLILKKDDLIIGRALLWYISDDLKVMDRIYTQDDGRLPSMFMNWADQNGFIYKFYQRWNNNCWFGSKGDMFYKEIKFKLDVDLSKRLPYLDTFKFYNSVTNEISNVPLDDYNTVLLISPDGGYNSDPFHIKQCHMSKEFYFSSDVAYVDSDKHGRIFVHKQSKELIYSEVNDKYLLREDAYRHPRFGWLFKDKSVNSDHILEYIKEEAWA